MELLEPQENEEKLDLLARQDPQGLQDLVEKLDLQGLTVSEENVERLVQQDRLVSILLFFLLTK